MAIFFLLLSGSTAFTGDSLIVDGHSQSSVLFEMVVPLVTVLIWSEEISELFSVEVIFAAPELYG